MSKVIQLTNVTFFFFKLKNFIEAMAFTTKVALVAEKEDHHPLIVTEWGRVRVQPEHTRVPLSSCRGQAGRAIPSAALQGQLWSQRKAPSPERFHHGCQDGCSDGIKKVR